MTAGFLSQVPMHRMAVNHWDNDAKAFKPTEGLTNHVQTRAWSLVRTVEGGAKTAIAAVAYLVMTIAAYVFAGAGAQAELLKDVTSTQFHSFWRCALSICSPDKALASMLDEKQAWRLGGTEKKWGTEYDPEKSTTVEKLYVWTRPQTQLEPRTT